MAVKLRCVCGGVLLTAAVTFHHAEYHYRITARLFIGAGCQNNTSVSACLHASLHACFRVKTATDCMEGTFGWSKSSPSNNQTHVYIHTRTYTARAFLWYSRLYANTASIYLRLLLLILERIFPFRSQSVAVIVKVVNDRYLHVLCLHLSLSQLAHFLLRGWRIPDRWRA